MEKLKLLYVDDEPISLKNFEMTFKRDYKILTATSAREGQEILEREKDVALVIADQRMPEQTGSEFLAQLVDQFPDTVRMILTAFTDVDEIIDAINRGHVYRYIIKPWEEKELRAILERAGEAFRLKRKDTELVEAFKEKSLSMEKFNEELKGRLEAHNRTIQELETSEERFRSVVASAADAIVTTTTGGKVTFWNEGAERIFGYTSAETMGRPFSVIFAKGERRTSTRALKDMSAKAAKAKGKAAATAEQTIELIARRKDGSEVPVDLSRSAWRTREGLFFTTIIRDATGRKKAEEQVRKREAELEIHSRNLQEVNAALNVLLARKEDDKRELEERILASVKKLAIPYLEKLKETELNSTQMAYVTILEANLKEIVSPVTARVTSRYLDLTPKEIQVANLIKEGKSNKNIARVMQVSINTILFHRHNLRKKLGLLNQKQNLRSYLTSIPT